LISMNS